MLLQRRKRPQNGRSFSLRIRTRTGAAGAGSHADTAVEGGDVADDPLKEMDKGF